MTVNYSQVFIFISMLLTFSACKSNSEETKEPIDYPKSIYCIPTTSLYGKDHLNHRYLHKVDSITTEANHAKSFAGMVLIKGGSFEMGGDTLPSHGFENKPSTAGPQADEFPKVLVSISDFFMDEHEVTVGEFKSFVEATGYVTVAEEDILWEELQDQLPAGTPVPSEESLKAGSMIFRYSDAGSPKNNMSNWWHFVQGASWKKPQGIEINLDTILDHPVTHVSWYDAMAYAKWVDKRLPTEAEYEYAMRAGRAKKMYPWGNEKTDSGEYKCNSLQGEFPVFNTAEDGYERTAPVMSFKSNEFGLYDIAGNVWEWTNDWYAANQYKTLSESSTINSNPRGPERTREVYDTNSQNKVVRGGSFLCHDDWCSGYRNARRMRLSPDSGMEHIGFRLVRSRDK